MIAARALLAFQRGEETDEGLIGGMLVAEHYSLIRSFLMPKKKPPRRPLFTE